MGVATESFIIVVTWAGFVAIIFLMYSLVTRVRQQAGKRGIFQRMPFLLPAIAFAISIFIILQLGITPIQQYRGANTRQTYFTSDTEIRYNVYDSPIAYGQDTSLVVSSYLEPSQSVEVVINIYMASSLIDALTIQLVAGENESTIDAERVLNLDPGNYVIDAEATYYADASVADNYGDVYISFTQETLQSIFPELVQWSTFQFAINIGCFFFILGGICIGKEEAKTTERRVDDYDKKEETSGEYRSYEW